MINFFISLLQILSQIYVLSKHREAILLNVKIIRRIYLEITISADNRLDALKIHAALTLLLTRIMFIVYNSSAFVGCLVPGIVYLICGRVELVGPVYIPFVDQKTFAGYSILYVFHCLAIFSAGMNITCGDILFSNMTLNSLLFGEAVATEFKKLNGSLLDKSKTQTDIKRHVREIMYIQLRFMR